MIVQKPWQLCNLLAVSWRAMQTIIYLRLSNNTLFIECGFFAARRKKQRYAQINMKTFKGLNFHVKTGKAKYISWLMFAPFASPGCIFNRLNDGFCRTHEFPFRIIALFKMHYAFRGKFYYSELATLMCMNDNNVRAHKIQHQMVRRILLQQ